MTTTISRCLAAVAFLLAGPVLAGCSDSDPEESTPSPSATAPTGPPFSAELEGPDFARAGDVVTVSIANTGRLPDKFALRFDPEGAATSNPLEVSLSPGESAEVEVTLTALPLVMRLESIGGGTGNALDRLSVGEEQ